jgi:hypothetical protein
MHKTMHKMRMVTCYEGNKISIVMCPYSARTSKIRKPMIIQVTHPILDKHPSHRKLNIIPITFSTQPNNPPKKKNRHAPMKIKMISMLLSLMSVRRKSDT